MRYFLLQSGFWTTSHYIFFCFFPKAFWIPSFHHFECLIFFSVFGNWNEINLIWQKWKFLIIPVFWPLSKERKKKVFLDAKFDLLLTTFFYFNKAKKIVIKSGVFEKKVFEFMIFLKRKISKSIIVLINRI